MERDCIRQGEMGCSVGMEALGYERMYVYKELKNET
jgi:hypothetical protein